MEDILIIISKYLSGSATREDELRLDDWRKADVANEQKFQELAECWRIIQADKHRCIPDKEKVWNKIMDDINASKTNNRIKILKTNSFSSRFRYIRTALVAASVALVLGVVIGKLPFGNIAGRDIQWTSMTSSSDGKTELCLADGTKVLLNSNSTLYYPSDFGKGTRDVRLDGQAYFDVTKDKTRQFSVSVGGIKVKILGTAFDIDGYKDKKSIEVIVHRGHVKVVNGMTDCMLADLHANEKTIVDRKGLSKGQTTFCDTNMQSLWRLNILKIDGENLSNVVRMLENRYGVHIHLGKHSEGKLYWITIKTESLRETLNIIDKINPIDYRINGKEVNIRERH